MADGANGHDALAGIRVVECGDFVAPSFAAKQLADLGADVVKIERPGAGDDTRHWTPQLGTAMSPTYATFNRGKRSLALDLDHPQGRKDHASSTPVTGRTTW